MQHFEKSQFKPGDLVKYVQQMIDRHDRGGHRILPFVEHYGLIQSLALDDDGVWWGVYIVLIDGRQHWINESQLERIECAEEVSMQPVTRLAYNKVEGRAGNEDHLSRHRRSDCNNSNVQRCLPHRI